MVITENDKIMAYINDVCSQIKFREVHNEIKIELISHFQEIVEGYLLDGFSENEVVSKAINQMGSAEIVGKQLNKVHKPKPEWSILSISLIFVSLGLLAMHFIEKQGLFTATPIPIFTRSLIFIIIGAVIGTGLYFFDYRKLEPYSKHIYLVSVLTLVIVIILGQRFNDNLYLRIGPLYLNIVDISPLLLSIALSGIFNNWDWNKPKKLFQGLLLCVVPLILILVIGSMSNSIIYSITCIILMIVSGARYRNSLVYIGIVSGMMIMLSIISTPYRLFINPEKEFLGSGWTIQLSKLISNSGLYGHGFTQKLKNIPYLHTDFMFSYITVTFGWIVGSVLAALVVIYIIRISSIISVVKNNYARLLISGFVTIFALQFLWNIFMNLGLAPISGVGLPFMSFGGTPLIFNAAILGIISSIYRRRYVSKTVINNS
ncbi:Cell division membrane protein-like protein [Desulfofarcimen acetoxidans DSM 771]|uniref:Cell division membrane protein-like protein n=1 Tax=Desulfofarcimen acetoxidans (strain ATCC 49208 / DSM 771 / KCTC 5769 / VKM B-1644 / 5575) TaxID=485916 RepID=C8VZL8_DESAS|nr:FtsW/RodA/SpoVE family cell cycle protein [Desulfofarcimen acetoxidans]ACV62996.1 Cell division membrane protein-like protein [Desulfofarcimen acetoxidans DSM 771]